MLLNPGLSFLVCCGAQDWVGWECCAFWWWWVVLVSVSKILTFAFRHLVFSGASFYSCLWLELVPQVIMLVSISRPGRLVLSLVSVVTVLCRQALLLQGRCPDISCSNLPAAEVVFHSLEVLRSCGGYYEDLLGVRKLCTQGTPVLEWTRRDLCPWPGQVICFLS